MEITILDTDDNRYDPKLVRIEEDITSVVLIVEHATVVPFSEGDQARFVLASDTYAETESATLINEREVVETVVGICQSQLSVYKYVWKVKNIEAIYNLLQADENNLFFERQ